MKVDMRIPSEVICKVCRRVFCCAECRHKHEIRTHAVVVRCRGIKVMTDNGTIEPESKADVVLGDTLIYLFCAICEARPLALREDMHSEMLAHIQQHHLPLHCRKCAKVYNKIDDLKSFSKCMEPLTPCQSEEKPASADHFSETNVSKVTVKHAPVIQNNISTQTTPTVAQSNLTDLTPISLINVRWKSKSKVVHDEFSCDSVSSIKNNSYINNCSSAPRTVNTTSRIKGKLVRSTSTPVQAELYFSKSKETVFSGSVDHVSSIYNSGCESEQSPQISNGASALAKPQTESNLNRQRKMIVARPRLVAVTPLRQVMSKSIQKAIAQHGIPSSVTTTGTITTLATSTSSGVIAATGNVTHSPSPLDLRLSPALRRTQMERNYMSLADVDDLIKPPTNQPFKQCDILLSTKRLTTESIVITRTKHLTSVQSVTSSDSSGCSSLSSTRPYKTAGSNSSDELFETAPVSAVSSGTSSVYESCRSVEIITSTELSNVDDILTNINNQISAYQAEEKPMKMLTVNQEISLGCNSGVFTPITRVPGGVIHKKLIKFETPSAVEEETVEIETNIASSKDSLDVTTSDVFYTPGVTPMKSPELDFRRSNESKKVTPRILNLHHSPKARPTYRRYAHSNSSSMKASMQNFNNKNEGVSSNDLNENMFLFEQSAVKAKKTTRKNSWSLSSLLSSVIQIPAFVKEDVLRKEESNRMGIDLTGTSIIKRCASIAGSLVRSKPLMREEQLHSLKRKRTNTIDNYNSYSTRLLSAAEPLSPNSHSDAKRFRIQGRQPIDRMRHQNNK